MDDGYHRKIELQSAEDMAFLVHNARRTATAHLDEAFPPIQGAGNNNNDNNNNSEGGKDEMRARIEELVEEYIAQVFAAAAPNLAINGMDISTMAPFLATDPSSSTTLQEHIVYEPFDDRKRQRLVDLAAEEEDLLRDIAALKRRVPRDVAVRFAEGAKAGLCEDEEALAKRLGDEDGLARAHVGYANARGRKSAAVPATTTLSAADPTMDGREDEVRKGFSDAVERLARLKNDMAVVVARMERAKSAGEYVVAKSR